MRRWAVVAVPVLAVAVTLATPPPVPSPARTVVAASFDVAPATPTLRTVPVPDLASRAAVASRDPFDRIADCETGGWVNGGTSFVEGSARWDAVGGRYSGGIQWLPSSWLAWKAPDDPPSAHAASRDRQIAAAERYRAYEQAQGRGGYGPWPTCARLLGLPR